MATLKQKMAAKKITENHGNVSKTMREVGYSENSAKKPSNLTESKGFKEEMAKYGLTDELIVSSLVEDIKIKKQDRKGELELGSKILRLTKDGETTNNIILSTLDEEKREILSKLMG